MQEMPGDAQALPDKRTRTPIIYAVIYKGEDGLEVTECNDRSEVKKFVNSLPDPSVVRRVYRVSAVIELKQKTVISF